MGNIPLVLSIVSVHVPSMLYTHIMDWINVPCMHFACSCGYMHYIGESHLMYVLFLEGACTLHIILLSYVDWICCTFSAFFSSCVLFFFQMWLTVYFILVSDMILDSGNLSTETIGYSNVCTLQVSV